MVKYYFKNDSFIIEDYLNSSPFSSFLPAVAGMDGKPLWAFYNNRGQAMGGFGVGTKDTPITPFDSANLCYQNISIKSFRTFLKINGKFYEPFVSLKNKRTKMIINKSSISIEENINDLLIKVIYSSVPHEEYAALIRKVEFTNLKNEEVEVEICDGLPIIFPNGLSNYCYKELVSLMAAYCQVYNLDQSMPFIKFKTSTGDCSIVQEIKSGNGFVSIDETGNRLKNIVDPYNLFGDDLSLLEASKFTSLPFQKFINEEQQVENKLPCAFSCLKKNLKNNEKTTIYSIYGTFDNIEIFKSKLSDIKPHEIETMIENSEELIDELLKPISVNTSNKLFDDYTKQTLLDNNLRGGFPFSLTKDSKSTYYLYGRKHGDMERDYNSFIIPSNYYSSGCGNFRDVCQNRRSDIYLYPFIMDYNIRTFFDLIQLDGQNPLNVKPNIFICDDEKILKDEGFDNVFIRKCLNSGYEPYELYNYIKDDKNKENYQEIFNEILKKSHQEVQANFSEGYWIDHWSYLVDLLINFKSVYPNKIKELLLNGDYRYFYSLVYVEPRSEKYSYIAEGQIRQYGAIDLKKLKDECEKKNFDISKTYWLKDNKDKIIKTTLASKIFNLILIKFSTLDNKQLGIEMECEKPGWNDAMNGLPGMFASAMSETVELLRLVDFSIDSFHFIMDESFSLLEEQSTFYRAILVNINDLINKKIDSFTYWDNITTARENFREVTHNGVSGETKEVNVKFALSTLKNIKKILNEAIKKAKELGEGILPSYFIYEPTEYELLDRRNHLGYKTVKVTSFKLVMLPYFLEAPARSFKLGKHYADLKEYNLIKKTDLYDKKFHFYKTCASLDDAPFEIGRIHAFTKGWLERECNFLHMDYKYMLGLLKCGLYKEFYKDIKTNLVCNLNPRIYGRSPIENSTFIVPSCNPDPKIHGKGYFARLTGANAEMLDIITYMFLGEHMFEMNDGILTLSLEPKLSKEFFKNKEVSITLFDGLNITYHNETNIDAYNMKKITYEVNGKKYDVIKGDMAEMIQNEKIKSIKCYIE